MARKLARTLRGTSRECTKNVYIGTSPDNMARRCRTDSSLYHKAYPVPLPGASCPCAARRPRRDKDTLARGSVNIPWSTHPSVCEGKQYIADSPCHESTSRGSRRAWAASGPYWAAREHTPGPAGSASIPAREEPLRPQQAPQASKNRG